MPRVKYPEPTGDTTLAAPRRTRTRINPPNVAHNEEVAAAFGEMAELLAIEGENPSCVRACERARP